MKCVFLALALVVPSLSMAAFSPLVDQHADVSKHSPSSLRHRPLFEVRYVLVKATPTTSNLPAFDFGDGKAAISPLSISAEYAVPLAP